MTLAGRRLRAALFVTSAFMAAASGCVTAPRVRPQDDEDWFRSSLRSALSSDEPSDRAVQFLREQALLGEWRGQPTATLTRIAQQLATQRERPIAAVLAELCYLQAKSSPARSVDAPSLYASAALSAHAYLFADELHPPASPYDPRFRLCCDVYNRALARLLEYSLSSGLCWGKSLRIETIHGPLQLTARRSELAWETGEFSELLVAYNFRIEGLANPQRSFGLGVPVIALRPPAPPERQTPQDRFLPRNFTQAYPATIVLELRGSLFDRPPDSPLEGLIDIYDPYQTGEVRIAGRVVPLETDFSTPLGYMLAKAPPMRGIVGLFDARAWEETRGLYMTHPYEPGKIPVVFIHGLFLGPLSWVQMMNDLTGDAELREKYQFWLYVYPSANPILYSGAVLRDTLREVRQTFDPQGRDPAFDQMVLVGSSMGGLLARLALVRGGDSLWNAVTQTPIDELEMEPAQREALRHIFYFEPAACVRRVIFMATPHRGSKLADAWISRAASRRVVVAPEVSSISEDLYKALARTDPAARRHHPTGLNNLSPSDPVLRALGELPIAPGVAYHSIIGNVAAADTPGGSDLIVEYSSSHLEGAASEKIIRATHNTTVEPAAIREVKRILREALESHPHPTSQVAASR